MSEKMKTETRIRRSWNLKTKTQEVRQLCSLILLLSCTLQLAYLPALADDDKNDQSSSSAQSSQTGAQSDQSAKSGQSGQGDQSSQSGQPLQAGAQVIELNLQMLRDLGLDLKHILKASSSLYDEVTIQPVSLTTQPEVIGRGIIVNIPVGFQPVGPAPQPKKQRVDLFMAQMRPIIELLKKDSDDFDDGKRKIDIDAQEQHDLQPLFDQWKQSVKDISAQLVDLEGLTTGPKYENTAIADKTTEIHNTAKKMDNIRRKVYKYIQKHGKKGNA